MNKEKPKKDLLERLGWKKFLLFEIFLIPAFFGFLFVPFLLILYQFGWANLENSLRSKILVSFSALCMYVAYGFLIAHLRRTKKEIEKLRGVSK